MAYKILHPEQRYLNKTIAAPTGKVHAEVKDKCIHSVYIEKMLMKIIVL